MPTLLRVDGLSKRFGDYQALADVSFDVNANEILGLIGPNGAGKTTLLECIVGLLKQSGGSVYGGDATQTLRDRRSVMFYMPDGVCPYVELYTISVIKMCARINGLSIDQRNRIIESLELEPVLEKRVSALSKGYRRRFRLALALMVPRELLRLDGPLDGLDPRQTRSVMDFLQELRSAERTLLLSIHQLTDAERGDAGRASRPGWTSRRGLPRLTSPRVITC